MAELIAAGDDNGDDVDGNAGENANDMLHKRVAVNEI